MRFHRHKPMNVTYSYGSWTECEKCGERMYEDSVSFLTKAKTFVTEVAKATVRKIEWFVKGVYNHAEAIAVLTLASIGLNLMLGEMPFIFMLPMWIEGPLVIPVLSVVLIGLLVKFMEWRFIRRDHRNVLA